jgi:Glycosyl transferase family 2
MTLLARDEADVIDAQLLFHLNAGVDFVVATDNRSQDGTREILEAYAREGFAHVIDEPGEDLRQAEWVTRMARLAATEFAADWVISSDADEFWMPRQGNLNLILAAVPERFGIVHAFCKSFVPRPDDGSFFADRMIVRLTASAPINDPASPYRPVAKVIYRADPRVKVARGSHALVNSALLPLRGWHPIDVLHLPIRSVEQSERKAVLQWTAFSKSERGTGTAYHAKAYQAYRDGRSSEYYDSLALDESAVEQGLADRSLALDTRLRDSLRSLRGPDGGARRFLLPSEGASRLDFAPPSAADEAAHAVDAAVLAEADLVRFQRRLDDVEQQLTDSHQR